MDSSSLSMVISESSSFFSNSFSALLLYQFWSEEWNLSHISGPGRKDDKLSSQRF